MPPREDFDNSKIIYYVLIAIVLIAFIALNYYNFRKHVSSNSQTINQYTKPKEHIERKPAVAGLFYSEDKVKLDKEVNHYLSVDFQNSEHQPQMLIVPHAGYEYSAATAAKAYAQLQKYANKIKRVVLVGPSHKVVFDGIATSGNDSFVTPLGRVPVNKTMVKNVTKNGDIIIFEGAHAREHSIEVQLPFLQKVLKKFSILPLVYSNVTPEELAEELKPFLGRQDTVIVFSADLSHYLDYDTAQKVDNHTANMIAKKNADISYDMSCGATGINAALILAKRNSLHPELLDLRNSGDAKGGKTQVVGYGSWMFTSGENTEVEEELTPIEQEEKNIKDFISLHKKEIIDIARKSLEEAVLHDSSYSPSRDEYTDNMFDKGASFVTLEKNKELRGCIGTIVPHTAISHDIARNTYKAALEDDRFEPVTEEELKDISIHISLLTDFERIRYLTEDDLLEQVIAGTDGLIIRDGNRQGLFLPAVWEKIPDKKTFLRELKIKAGISPSYQNNKIKIYRFRTVGVENED